MSKVVNRTHEGYYDYMLRRSKEEIPLNLKQNTDDVLKNTIREMQKEIHSLQIRVKELHKENYELRKKCQHT
tara:strand:+ start:690 stop:905 length:216 start_codon:yes stop_codon:yes gene_type:complete